MLAADVESFRNLTSPDTDNEGVAQEVFLAAFRSLASFDPKRSAFSTWLFTIARNRCRNRVGVQISPGPTRCVDRSARF